ncbi:class I SAM-dependent methyltransferase [Methylovorus sp. MM2]|uniref:class I SAM-dependent methyltransferase n=1 Tax=Methylovorus sp. MM2 TaxID=1848038 RepID=UPI000B049FC7|nr:class I SAM-dependent methyltransferase [Methylovorus sp. MM2]
MKYPIIVLLQFIQKKRIAPSLVALFIQCLSLALVFILAKALDLAFGFRFSITEIVLLQAILSAGMSYLLQMAVWWRYIHFIFPFSVFLLSFWAIPNSVYLWGFLISAGLFWSTFRTQVPFYPSRPIVWREVDKLLPKSQVIDMVDIGSGIGDLLMHLAASRPESRFLGIEIAPLPWLVSKVRGWLRHSPAIFKLGDYESLDFSKFDVVFAYLSPAAMPKLWEKASKEMRKETLLISYEFDIAGITPSFEIKTNERAPMIYVWKL